MFCDTSLTHEEWTIGATKDNPDFATLAYKRSPLHDLGDGKRAKIDGLSRFELESLGKAIAAYLALEPR